MAGRKFLPGDDTIFAEGNVHNQREMETFYNRLGAPSDRRWGWGWGRPDFGETQTTVQNQPVGNLVIDIGFPRRISRRSPKKNEGKLDWDIDKMFAKFPPMK